MKPALTVQFHMRTCILPALCSKHGTAKRTLPGSQHIRTAVEENIYLWILISPSFFYGPSLGKVAGVPKAGCVSQLTGGSMSLLAAIEWSVVNKCCPEKEV